MFKVQPRRIEMRRMSVTAMSVAFILAIGMQISPSVAFAKEPLRILTCPKKGGCKVGCVPGEFNKVSLVYILEMAGSHSLIEIHSFEDSISTVLAPSTASCLFSGMQDASVTDLDTIGRPSK